MITRPLLAVVVAFVAFALQGHMSSYESITSLAASSYSENCSDQFNHS
ncbi:hypothetical protein D884_03311 [Pseudomonas sp. URMO17WK12:I10]|nr:hypothetical protein F633_02856 [Pseudomonas sp. LAMO17WK12:I3]RED04048.1 hypothetical protein D884_03311 [Pseudomonas sp. URMO17WK12:I10]SOD10294.1 hypothetical protein SAMN05660967_03509 [Pseudomonas sp. URMO17WK12:I9]